MGAWLQAAGDLNSELLCLRFAGELMAEENKERKPQGEEPGSPVPSISLSKRGGAVKGIRETFKPNLFTPAFMAESLKCPASVHIWPTSVSENRPPFATLDSMKEIAEFTAVRNDALKMRHKTTILTERQT
ncbi:MAG: hypothetical protein CV087_16730 [Candidatus Brocadia sp. WS118]|nr:MAG: hypothetical protein CV087_16730 [Candidatus Brocadia sp. WS118]